MEDNYKSLAHIARSVMESRLVINTKGITPLHVKKVPAQQDSKTNLVESVTPKSNATVYATPHPTKSGVFNIHHIDDPDNDLDGFFKKGDDEDKETLDDLSRSGGHKIVYMDKNKPNTKDVEEETSSEAREKIEAVARPTDKKANKVLVKQTEITRKIIEGNQSMFTKNLGLSDSLISSARQIMEAKEELNKKQVDPKKMGNGVTKVDTTPTLNTNMKEAVEKTKAPSCKVCGKSPCVCSSVKEEAINATEEVDVFSEEEMTIINELLGTGPSTKLGQNQSGVTDKNNTDGDATISDDVNDPLVVSNKKEISRFKTIVKKPDFSK